MASEEFKIYSSKTFQYPFQGSLLKVSGSDALAFLNRMSTQNLESLSPHKSVFTVFLNAQGRIVDAAYACLASSDAVWLLSAHCDPNHLLSWLEKYHFMESLKIEDIHKLYRTYWVIGPESQSPTKKSKNAHAFSAFRLRIEGCPEIPVGFFIDESHDPGYPEMDIKTWEALRVAALMAGFPQEISSAFHPLEVGLLDAISFDKGCYLGQEVVSKIETYQKRSKGLFGILASPEAFGKLKPGQLLFQNDHKLGQITSVSPIYYPKIPIALAVAQKESPKEVYVASNDERINVSLVHELV